MSYLTKANASPFTPIQIENPDLNLTIPEVDESILTDDQSGIMSKIRVSRRNKSILEKLGFEDPVAKAVLQFSPEQVNHMVEEEVRARRRGYTGSNLGESLLKPEQKRGYIENGSCFMWYIVNEKSLSDVIPDYEIEACKKVFQETLAKLPTSWEAHFGLGRILAYEGKHEESVNHLRAALRQKPKDSLSLTWYEFVQLKTAKNKAEILKLKNGMDLRLKEMPKLIETLWGMMEISLGKQLESGIEIEVPQYYASNIKELDTYYGYLAWTMIFFKENQEERAMKILREIIRSNPERPEAYLMLWQHYYYKLQSYDMSEELAAEAFLRVTDYENHQYYILFCIIYAKSYHKNGRLVNCLELLMQKYNEHPTYTMFLYHYGRICAKSADLNYTNSAIDALQESIRLCNKSRYGKIYYWLSKVLYQKQNYYKAFKAIKKALKYLTGHINSPKINEIKILYEDLKPKYEITQDLKTRLNINEISPEEANHSRNLIVQIKTFDKELSEIFEAKILWIQNEEDDAIDFLDDLASSDVLYIKAYALVFKYLMKKNKTKLMRKIAKAMISRCKVHKFPVSVWMKMHVLYADSLAFDSNPTEAILVLKSLAKVFPPLPFAEIPFTKTLKRSKNLEDLNNASGKSLETSKSYSYTNYRNTQANILNEDYFESYLGKSQNTDFNEKKSKRYPLKVPQLGTDGFLICSNVKFLYKIAKIAVKYHENIEDGLCAIEDYLMMLKFNQHKNKKKVQTAKALYLKGFLLVESLNLMQGIQVMEEALPELDRLGQTTKTEKIRAFLSQNS